MKSTESMTLEDNKAMLEKHLRMSHQGEHMSWKATAAETAIVG